MTKFRYTDWTTVKTNLSNARITTLGELTQYQQCVATFTQEEALQGATWQAAKEYISLTAPLAKGLANTLTDVGVVLDNYLTDFETTVNQTGKDLDSDKLRSLQKDLANIRAMKKATVAAVAKSHINDHLPSGEMNPYSGGVSTTAFDHNISSDTKKIKILDLYDDFEGRHTTDYTTIISALDSIKIGVQALNNPKNFNTTTGEFNPANLNNAEWYQNLTNYNATKRDPAIDVKTIQTPIYGAAGNVVGYDKQYEVYIDGQLNPEAGKKLIELENKEGLKFVSGILGITDFLEAISGKDPFTGEKVTSQERAKAIFWTVLIAVPVGKAASILNDVRRDTKVFIPEKVTLETGEVAYTSARGDLVRSADFLDKEGQIKWPENEGFTLDKLGNPIKYSKNLKAGQVIDRYGDSFGTFTSLVNNGHIVPFYDRGLPYAYTDKFKNYHQYKIVKDINYENIQGAYRNLSPEMKKNLTKSMKDYTFTINDISNPQSGKISKVFGFGGGQQIQLGTVVDWYEKLGMIEEIK